MADASIGFVGLGNMGAPMAARLLAAGNRLGVLDSRPGAMEPLVADGAWAAATPVDLAAGCDIVFLALPTPNVVESVVLGPDGLIAAGAGTVVVDCSTTGPDVSAGLADRLAAGGVHLLDCPVSGGPAGARDGTLALIASGPADIVERVAPLLDCLGKLFVVGDRAGQAQTLKLVNNLLSLTALTASCEALALGVKAGLSPDTMIEVINASSGRNTATMDKIPKFVMSGSFDFGIAVGLSCKDAELCVDAARRHDMPMVIGSAVSQMLGLARDRYGFDADLTCAARLWEEWGGIEIRSGE